MGHPFDDTVTGLVEAWSGKPSLLYERDGQQVPLLVGDGPVLDDPDARRFLIVGAAGQFVFAGGEDAARYGYGGRRTDALQVSCELTVWSGDTTIGSIRADAYAVLDELGRLLALDRTLGGRVDRAEITGHTYRPVQGDHGAGVVLDIAVRATATRFEDG